MLSRGERIGRYLVESQIAVGGMAATYLCVMDGQSGFEKRVVVKMMRSEHRADDRYLEMFLDEARLSARLAHPSIPQVFELGDHDGLPFMVMEFIDGPSLYRAHRQITKKNLERPPGWAAHLFHQIAGALEYAAFGTDPAGQKLLTVHRDVSLANIMITQGGHAKLIDFGIAKAEARLHETEVGTLKGSIQYMAPEALAGEKDLDSRADIFSLGVCMFMVITGKSPYPGDDAVTVWNNRLKANKLKILSIRPDCPPELAAIVERAMEQEPAKRYQQPAQLAADLERLLQSNPSVFWGPAKIATWIAEIFPQGEQAWRPAAGRAADQSTQHTGSPVAARQTPLGSTQPPVTPLMYATPHTHSMQPPPTNDRALMPLIVTNVVVVLLLLFSVVGGGIWVMTRPDSAAVEVPAPAPRPSQLTVQSTPPGAQVWDGQKLLGMTPITVELNLKEGDQPRSLRLEAEGYEPIDLSQAWSVGDVTQSVQLRPIVAATPAPVAEPVVEPPPRPRPRPTPRPTPAPSNAPDINLER